MWKYSPPALAVVLAACAQPEPAYPVAYPSPPARYPTQTFPYPRPQQRPLQDASQQLSTVEQLLRQLQSLRGAVGQF
jgi:hypothetical protein